MFNPWVGKIPGEGHGKPLQYSCLEKPHGQRRLAGYSPCGRKEVDKTEATQHACINSDKTLAPPLNPSPLCGSGNLPVIPGRMETQEWM